MGAAMFDKKNIIGLLGLIVAQISLADISVPILEDAAFKKGFELFRELNTSNCGSGYESMCVPKKIKWHADSQDKPVWMIATWASQGSLTDSWGDPSANDYICTSGSETACELKAKVKSGLGGMDFVAHTNAAGMPLRWDGSLPVISITSPDDNSSQVSAAAELASLDTATLPSPMIYSSVTVPSSGGEISLKANTFNENYFKDVIPVIQPDGVTPVYSTPFLYETHTDKPDPSDPNKKMDDYPRGPYLWEKNAVDPSQPHLYLGQGAGLLPVSGMKNMNFHAKVKVIQDRLDTCDNNQAGEIKGCIGDTFGSAWTTFDFLFWNPVMGRSFNTRIPVFDMRNSFGEAYGANKVTWLDVDGNHEFGKNDKVVMQTSLIGRPQNPNNSKGDITSLSVSGGSDVAQPQIYTETVDVVFDSVNNKFKVTGTKNGELGFAEWDATSQAYVFPNPSAPPINPSYQNSRIIFSVSMGSSIFVDGDKFTISIAPSVGGPVYEKSQVYAADGSFDGKNISSYGGMGYQAGQNGGSAMSVGYYDNGTPTLIFPTYKFVPALEAANLIPGITNIDTPVLLDADGGNRVQRDGGAESCTTCPILRDSSGAVVGHPNHSYRKLINGVFYIDNPFGFRRSSQSEYSVLSTNPDPSRGTRFAADVGSSDDGTDDGYVSELGVVTHVESGWVTFNGDLLPYFKLAARLTHDSAVEHWITNGCVEANETNCIDPDTVDPNINNYRLNLIQVASWESNTLSKSELKISDLSFNAIVDGADDLDGDGLTNEFEQQNGFDPSTPTIEGATPDTTEAIADTDHDGISNLDEQTHGRNPLVADYQVSAGMYHTCALDDDGVKCWGLNDHGQTVVPALNNPIQISAGGSHTCALDKNAQGIKSVVCWGDNSQGQTAVPALSNPVSVSAGAAGTCAQDDNGVTCWGYNNEHQVDGVPTLNAPKQISASYHNCALDSAGVHCWGRNYEGQSTVPTLTAPRLVAAGGFHTCAVDGNAVKCWGSDSEGQSTLPSAATFTSPQSVAAGFLHTCVLDMGQVRCFTDNDAFGAATVPALSQPVQITAGWRHTCALDASGVKCWGAGTTSTGSEPNYGQSVVPYLNMFGWTKDTDNDGVHDDEDADPLNPLVH
jgi:hypothetical protein